MELKKLLYRVEEVADLISVGKSTVYDLVKDGELRCHNRMPGKKGMRITSDSLRTYINRHIVSSDHYKR